MPYIGRGIVSGNFTKLDSITTSATATYALTNGGAAFTPQSVNQMIVSLNGVIQAPTDAFTISGSNIVFDSALTSSDVIDFILVLGDVNDIGVPSDDSISAVKLKSSAVTAPKLADQSFEKGAYGSSSNPITYTVKVITKTAAHPYYGTGSSQGYEIDGVEAPVLKLNGSDAGKKYYYKFDQSDSSNSGHPLLFYLQADKTTAYTTNVTATGTPGSAGASTTIQVDEYTPNILYYQCSSHAHMGNHINHISNQVNTSGTLLKLPTADGSSGQFMKTDGSGNLSFGTVSGAAGFTLRFGAAAPAVTSGTHNFSPSTNTFMMHCVGGGGSGGTSGATSGSGRAGGAGAFGTVISPVPSPGSMSYSIGAGGAARDGSPSTPAGSGNAGGDTGVTSLFVAGGGAAGPSSNSGSDGADGSITLTAATGRSTTVSGTGGSGASQFIFGSDNGTPGAGGSRYYGNPSYAGGDGALLIYESEG